MKKILLLLSVQLLCSCKFLVCEFNDRSIVIDNNSSDTIRAFHLAYDKYTIHNQFDTVIHTNKSDYGMGHVLYNNRADWLTSWPEEEDVSQDTMTIFIIKKSVYDTVPWDSIAKNYMILQRYDVPAQYYMDHFWPRKHLAYPPTEDMREIPMWPAYETDK